MLTIYTLKNCDTCKKALKWLEAENINYRNIDVRADGLDRYTVENFVGLTGWEPVVNRRSTTWRQLSDSQKADIDDVKAVELILENPTLMKRPIFAQNGGALFGFGEETREDVKLMANY